MRYFDDKLVANSRPHAAWWGELCANREWWHRKESELCEVQNAAAILPRDAWLDLDGITRRIMRDDEGQAFMSDLMPLAKPVHIGKLVHLTRVSSDAGTVRRSMSGQVPIGLDKVTYDYRGAPVPIFATAYGREWREWNTLQSENFDALADDQEAHSAKIREDYADYALDGDATLTFQGYEAVGIRTSPLSKSINIGATGANIDLTSPATTADDIDAFFSGMFAQVLDDNLIAQPVNIYVSPEIMRRFEQSYSGSSGFKGGTLLAYLESKPRINKIVKTFKLTGNEFFGFVPNANYIRPLIGMATGTTAMVRNNPTDNYQFLIMGAMGLEIRADFAGKSGVFYSVNV